MNHNHIPKEIRPALDKYYFTQEDVKQILLAYVINVLGPQHSTRPADEVSLFGFRDKESLTLTITRKEHEK